MADIVLKVATGTLISKSNEITGKINEIERNFERIKSIVTASTGYWTGDASEKHQNFIKIIEPDLNNILKRLREHPEELLKMAGLYEEAEGYIAEMSKALPEDVIF